MFAFAAEDSFELDEERGGSNSPVEVKFIAEAMRWAVVFLSVRKTQAALGFC